MPKFILIIAAFTLAAVGAASSDAASVTFEAESGALGSDWAVSNSTSPAFVTIQSNSTANNPGTSNRIATCTVTFPNAGTYELYARLRVGPNGGNDASFFYGNGFGTNRQRPNMLRCKNNYVPMITMITDKRIVFQQAKHPGMIQQEHVGLKPGIWRTGWIWCFVFFAAFAGSVPSTIGQTIYEAENATVSGPSISTANAGYSGTGYADYNNNTGDYVEFLLNASSAGTYPIAFRYANGGTGDRPLQLTVNGVVVVSSLSFPVTGSWTTWLFTATNNVTFNAGMNTVRITAIGSSGANVDYLLVTVNGTQLPPPVCSINWSNTQQHIDGFGFSSAWCGTLSSAKNKALYGTLGMSLLRIRIDQHNSWGDETANSAAAHAYGIKVLGCPWKAPAYMTYTNVTSTLTNCYLLTNSYNAFALWLGQAATNINLDYVSVLNEPNLTSVDTTYLNMTADQIRIFCASNAPSIGRPVAMADAFNYSDSVSDPTLNDSNAVNNVAIVSGHFYGNGNYVHQNALNHGKPVWMTEHYLDGCTTNFPVCLNFAKEINDAMKNQFSAYIAWWAQDGDPNINLANSSGTILKDGYTLGQFAKFIRPGYYRMGTTSTGGGAQITAYKDLTTSNYVIVALNLGNTVITQQFNLNGFPAMPTNLSVTPWITSFTQSLAAQAPITNVGSSFTYSIQPSNIVTFVGTPLPATPTGLSATAGNSVVNLTWNAVAGATSYNVNRATVSGGPYTTVASTSATNCSDGGLAAQTTYYYVVSAIQGGGQSADSLEASATTPLFYSMGPVADAYVNDGGSANNNFGTAVNLAVKNDGGSNTGYNRITYLKFDVHTLTNVQSAKLILTPSQVDGVAGLAYQVWSNDNWTETGITWNNQPAGSGVTITNISNYTLWTAVTIDVTAAVTVQATNDGLLTIQVTEPAANNTRIDFCSKEYATAGYRPMLQYVILTNTPPVLAAITNQTIGAGVTLNITNSATDSDVPAQTLAFSLLTAPTNAVIDTNSGLLTWRPMVTQANSTNPFTVMVADNGTPSLSATQSFVVTVIPLAQPVISTPLLSAGQLVVQVNGASGPDYQIQSSTNLTDWNVIFTTNSPPVPFSWTSNINSGPPANFFRVLVGPPF